MAERPDLATGPTESKGVDARVAQARTPVALDP
jgi:hypothetical protein